MMNQKKMLRMKAMVTDQMELTLSVSGSVTERPEVPLTNTSHQDKTSWTSLITMLTI